MRTVVTGVMALWISTIFLTASPAYAVGTAASADDICSPAMDPCVVDQIYDVTGMLDFGLRKVLIVAGGRLRGQPNVSVKAGEIEIDVGVSADPNIVADGLNSGFMQLTAYRACSGDGSTRCLLDSQCGSGLGTCSAVSAGTITADGVISANGSSPGNIELSAAGDIVLQQRVSASATATGSYAGTIFVESFQGSVTTAGQIAAASDLGTFDYEAGSGGEVTINAAVDISIGSPVRVWGEGAGGQVYLNAQRDLVLHSDIISSGGEGLYAEGGYASLDAGRDISVVRETGGDVVQEISTDGGGTFRLGYGYGGYWASGYGGYQYLRAAGDISLGPDSNLHSQGGPGATGGSISLYAYYGDISMEGTIRAQGLPPAQGGETGAGGGGVDANAYGNVTFTRGAVIDTSSPIGQGRVAINGHGRLQLDGSIDVHGTGTGDYVYATPGSVVIGYTSDSDVTIGGKFRGGGNRDPDDDWSIGACRLHLTSSAVLDQTLDAPNPYGGGGIDIDVRESMVADEGSRIETEAAAGTKTRIFYRDAKKPPVLHGSINPAPLLYAGGGEGCPVCGNGEIDWSESCDDGNTVSGDGCRDDCQDEGCIAETPGFPATPLCDDGIPCSVDTCDPVAHSCQNVESCDDGVDCTVDACTDAGCQHTVDDARCDDRNDCTDDLCNSATGCVRADLTGGACEDGDFCTPAGTCEHGNCAVLPSTVATTSALKSTVSAGAHNDRLKAELELSADQLEVDPTLTGATLILGDATDHVVYQASLPAAQWSEMTRSTTHTFRFASAPGAADNASVKLVREAPPGVANAVVRVRGVELAGTLDQEQLSLSLKFGSGPPADGCVTARRIPCEQRERTITCR